MKGPISNILGFSLLSNPSKMPGLAWGIPAKHCKVGSKLRKVEGSVCADCYAHKNFYRMPNVQKTQQLRLDHYNHNPEAWVQDISREMVYHDCNHFRWFDSGDLQDEEMLYAILEVCRLLDDVKFWLPTREQNTVKGVLLYEDPPKNLCIRMSAAMVDAGPPKVEKPLVTSTVVTRGASCPAYTQSNECRDCRKCWDRRIKNVSYKLH